MIFRNDKRNIIYLLQLIMTMKLRKNETAGSGFECISCIH